VRGENQGGRSLRVLHPIARGTWLQYETFPPSPIGALLYILIGGEKFTVEVKGNPLFLLYKALNIGGTIIVGC
jgi:hypothetical protein